MDPVGCVEGAVVGGGAVVDGIGALDIADCCQSAIAPTTSHTNSCGDNDDDDTPSHYIFISSSSFLSFNKIPGGSHNDDDGVSIA